MTITMISAAIIGAISAYNIMSNIMKDNIGKALVYEAEFFALVMILKNFI